MNTYVRLLVLPVIALFLFSIGGDAFAQSLNDPDAAYDGLLEMVQASSNGWADTLRGYAVRLFWLLAGIQFIWTMWPLLMKGADLGEIVGELIRFVMVIGFFLALLVYSVEWASAVVDSFRDAGAAAIGSDRALRPGDMFGFAVELAQKVGSVPTINPVTAFTVGLAATVVMICFAFIAAFIGLTLVESYVVINASVLFMGFGASQWTREYAIAMMRYALAVGAKLFVLTLIVGLVMVNARQWSDAYTHNDASMWTMVGLAAVCAYLCKTIPELIQSLITGTSMGGGNAIGSMAAATLAMAAAVKTAGASAAAAGTASAAAGGAGAGAASSGGIAAAQNSLSMGGQHMAASTPMAGGTSGSGSASSAATSAGARLGGGAAGNSTKPAPGAQASGQPVTAPSRSAQQASQAGSAEQSQADGGQGSGFLRSPSMPNRLPPGITAPFGPTPVVNPSMSPNTAVASTGDEQPVAASQTSQQPQADSGPSPTLDADSSQSLPSFGPSTSEGQHQDEPAASPSQTSGAASGPAIMGAALDVGIRGIGTLSALSVPGMEAAPSLAGVGFPLSDREPPDTFAPSPDPAKAGSNIIRPADPPVVPAPGKAPPANVPPPKTDGAP